LVGRLAEEAERTGWRQAAQAVLADEPGLLKYVNDERSGDWRFILPRPPEGEALCVGGALSPLPLALARTCVSVAVRCEPAEGRFLLARARQEGLSNISVLHMDLDPNWRYDLVAVLRAPLIDDGREFVVRRPSSMANAVKSGGVLYLEVDAPALLWPPAMLNGRLRGLGFSAMRFYWPRPTFERCEALFPLGDRRLQRYYLDYQFFAMSPGRRVLRLLLRAASAAGLFEFTLPGYMVVARRTGGVRP
jgi:hypothetical protein